MTIYRKIGFAIVSLGFLMFLLGVDQFTSRGEINPILSRLGMIAFILWLPTIITGFLLIIFSKNKS